MSPSAPSPAAAPPRARRRRHTGRWVLLILLGVLAVLGFRLVQKARAVPAWVEQNRTFLEATQPAQLESLAQAIEIRAPREWTRPVGGGDGDRTLAFGFDEVNAWLALKLDRLLRNQGVKLPGLAGAMLTERGGQLVAAVSHDSGKSLRYYSLFFDVTRAVDDTGAQTSEPAFRLAAIRLGDQGLPLSLISRFADPDTIADASLRKLVSQLAAGEAVGPLILPVDAHRKARVKGFRVTETGVELDVQVSYNDTDTK